MMPPTYADLALALDALWAESNNDGEAVTPSDDAIARAEKTLERISGEVALPYFRGGG